jgi:hypothetical protein
MGLCAPRAACYHSQYQDFWLGQLRKRVRLPDRLICIVRDYVVQDAGQHAQTVARLSRKPAPVCDESRGLWCVVLDCTPSGAWYLARWSSVNGDFEHDLYRIPTLQCWDDLNLPVLRMCTRLNIRRRLPIHPADIASLHDWLWAEYAESTWRARSIT